MSLQNCDLDLHFDGKKLNKKIFRKRQELAQKCLGNIYRFWHLSSNGIIAKIVLWLWPIFWRSNILNLHILETVKAGAKISGSNLCRLWHLPSEGVIAKIIYIMWPWPTFWRSKIKKINSTKTVRASAKMCGRYSPLNGVTVKIVLWPWPTFQTHVDSSNVNSTNANLPNVVSLTADTLNSDSIHQMQNFKSPFSLMSIRCLDIRIQDKIFSC